MASGQDRQNESLIELRNLSKRYRGSDQFALVDVNLKIARGDKLGLIGANGSGKTTLLKLVLNFLRPTSGQILLLGNADLEANKALLGYVPEAQEGLENFTPQELLLAAGRMQGLTREQVQQRSETLLRTVELSAFQHELVGGFSKGMVQRLQIALALLHQPEVLLLDEPLSGIDPQGQHQLIHLLQNLSPQTLVYASHRLDVVEQLCNRTAILQKGRLVALLEKDDLQEEMFLLEVDPAAARVMEKFPGVSIVSAQKRGDRLHVELVCPGNVFQKLMAQLQQQQIAVQRIRSRSLLEHYYLQYVQQE